MIGLDIRTAAMDKLSGVWLVAGFEFYVVVMPVDTFDRHDGIAVIGQHRSRHDLDTVPVIAELHCRNAGALRTNDME